MKQLLASVDLSNFLDHPMIAEHYLAMSFL